MMISNLREFIINKTNEKGKEFIRYWIKNPIAEVRMTPGNWFIAIDTKDVAYSLPYKESCAHPAHFGDRKHADKEYPVI
jgi:hypothetical protein